MKKDNKSIKWLYDELPELIDEGILNQGQADKLKSRYGEVKHVDVGKVTLTIFGIIGSVLIGGGIILILAHNWDNIGRPVRAILAFLPLVAAQIITGLILWYNKGTAWKEGSGAFMMLALGAAIAIIGQTYNLGGDLSDFLLTWMLVSLPIVYLLNNSTAAVLYISGITWRACHFYDYDERSLIFWLLLALVVPHILVAIFKDRHSARTSLLLWVFTIAITIACGVALKPWCPGLWILTYSGIFALFYLLGRVWFDQPVSIWRRPLYFMGGMGIVTMAFVFTFEGAWEESYWYYSYRRYYAANLPIIISAIWLAAVYITDLVHLILAVRKKTYYILFMGIMPLLAVCGFFICRITGNNYEIISMLLFNFYLAVLGIACIVRGFKLQKLGKMNAGMGILSLLILMRFFDSDMNILIRGLAFIIIGAGFLAANFFMVRIGKKKKMEAA